MIYSKWKPSKGGYDYYQANDKDIPFGNDLPIPVIPRGTDIGVASTVCGRKIPIGAKYAGSGDQAIGLIAPTETGVFSGITTAIPTAYWQVAFGVVLGWAVFKKKVFK